VTVKGVNFNRRAEIRWNSIRGPLLAKSSREQFSVKVRVPKAPSGLYSLVAVTRDQTGGLAGVSSTPLQIVSLGSSRSGGPPPPAGRGASPSRTRSSTAAAVAGGLGLLALGGLAGALVARRPQPQ
jgi:hypothetical protein